MTCSVSRSQSTVIIPPCLDTENNGVSSRGWRSAEREPALSEANLDLTPCSSASAIRPACSAVQSLMLVCVTQIASRGPSFAAATSRMTPLSQLAKVRIHTSLRDRADYSRHHRTNNNARVFKTLGMTCDLPSPGRSDLRFDAPVVTCSVKQQLKRHSEDFENAGRDFWCGMTWKNQGGAF